MADSQLIELTADIVSAHVSHNDIPTADVPSLIQSVFEALKKAAEPVPAASPKAEPAVSIRASSTCAQPDHDRRGTCRKTNPAHQLPTT